MHVLLSLGSALFYGAADFVGGLATRRANAVAVVILSQASGLFLLVLVLPVLPESAPSAADFAWGAGAGLAGGIGVALLYQALAIGTMGIVAPTTAVCAVAIPVVVGVALGERPAPVVVLGIGLAMTAIVMVSRPASAPTGGQSIPVRRALPPGLPHALLSGVAIGLFFLALSRTGAGAGLWPLVAARATSVTFFTIVAAVGGYSLRMQRPEASMSVGGGVLDMLANVLYLVASRTGALTVVVTLASLYPASTVVLARLVLGERLSAWQRAGIICAMAAVALIVGGAG